ncbi:hypothetical protein FT688_02655 [Aeromonas hydrophila]|nr:hypothetical protein FT688_02655 [Aeromonas hydrophila]
MLGLDAKDGLIRRAAFDDDAATLHVAADTISDPKRMREILRHEVLAHYGLANVLGDGEYTKLMSRLIQSQKNPSMKPVWDWVNTHYADEDIGTKAEEVVAHLAELEQGPGAAAGIGLWPGSPGRCVRSALCLMVSPPQRRAP